MGQPVELTIDAGLATLRLDRKHGNAINDDLVQAMMTAAWSVLLHRR